MGQKVNPHGIRLGIVKDWDARWYADKDFAQNLHEDIKIRDYLKKSLQTAGVPRVETERSKNRLKLTIHTAKPGMVIGRGARASSRSKRDSRTSRISALTSILQRSSSRTSTRRSSQRTLRHSLSAASHSAVR